MNLIDILRVFLVISAGIVLLACFGSAGYSLFTFVAGFRAGKASVSTQRQTTELVQPGTFSKPRNKRLVIALALCAAFFAGSIGSCAVQSRYQIIPSEGKYCFRIDRLTGQMWSVSWRGATLIKEPVQ
jgi:hypothetical protein